MYRKLAVIAVLIGSFAVSARAQSNPLVGTWKTNPAKSKVYLGGAATSQTVKYEASGANAIKYSSDRVGGDGTKSHVEFTATFDGSTAPYKGVQDRDAIKIKKIDANTYQVFYLNRGEVVQINFWMVSKDGKTLTTVSTGVGTDKRVFNRIVVADKQ
jgi:hypothetical protein